MTNDLRAFWESFQGGMEIVASGASPETLLGVRDGFRRYFGESLSRPVPVSVTPHEAVIEHGGLYLSDATTLGHARAQARELERRLEGGYAFFVGTEGGLHDVELEGEVRYFVRCWTVVRASFGEAFGGSGSVEVPQRLISGLENSQIPFAVPGTRRSGGMISSLTGGLETRRTAVALSTFHAVSSLLYGILESRPRGRSRRP
jgi:non-canonical (house-cleaning) NTP pyrophosphatase